MGDLVLTVLAHLEIAPEENRLGRVWARCPYHDDANPSWFVRVTKERYGQHHCFACKAGGGLVDLVMHRKDLDRSAAHAWLRERGGEAPEPIEKAAPPGVDVRVEAIVMRSFAMSPEVIFEPLKDWVSPPRRYVEGRGITAGQVERWGLGYAVDGRLGGRVVIPIRTRDGAAVSYMARDFSGSEKSKRYLYPTKFEAPDLDTMFGERWWPVPRERKRATVFLTEGALDALAVERVSRTEPVAVAALGGSDVRPAHVSLLSTFRRVVVMTDPDDAGDRAAEHVTAALLRYVEVCRVRLPVGTDANKLEPERLAGCVRKVLALC